MKRHTTGALVTAALLTFTACGGGDTVDEAVEAGIEEALGSNADVEVDGDGDIKIETDEGSYTAGDMAEVPDNFPSEIPLPDGLTLLATASSTNNWSLTYSGTDLPDGYCEDFLAEYEAAGFEETSRFESSGDFTLFYETGQYSITVSCQPSLESVVVGVLSNES